MIHEIKIIEAFSSQTAYKLLLFSSALDELLYHVS
jgi:hypothetical protein